jgi:hypothetical protein
MTCPPVVARGMQGARACSLSSGVVSMVFYLWLFIRPAGSGLQALQGLESCDSIADETLEDFSLVLVVGVRVLEVVQERAKPLERVGFERIGHDSSPSYAERGEVQRRFGVAGGERPGCLSRVVSIVF